MVALVADFQHQHGRFVHDGRRGAQQAAHEVHAVGAASERQRRFRQVLGRQRGHAAGIDVRRIAQDQVPRPGQRRQAVRFDQRDAIVELMARHIDGCNLERFGRDVGCGDLHVRVGQGGQDGEAAVAGAQVEHLTRVLAEPVVDAAVGQQFGDEAARHDRAFVDVEGHALQPGFLGEIGGRLAGLDAGVDQRRDPCRVGWRHRPVGGRVDVVDRQPQLPQHQPGGFVEGVVGAVAEGDAGVGQPACAGLDQFDDGVVHDANLASSASSVRR